MRDDATVPYTQKSPDQRRRYHTQKAKESRQRKKDAEQITEGARCRTRAEYWEYNRAKLSAEELTAALELHDECMSYVRWLRAGAPLLSPEDPDHVSMDSMVEDLVDFVREHPSPRLGYETAGDLPPDWGEYWKDAILLEAIAAEGPATLLWARTGILSGLPDHYVIRFLTDQHAETGLPVKRLREKAWSAERARELVGMTTTRIGDSSEQRYKP
jgi:hypothetical protein